MLAAGVAFSGCARGSHCQRDPDGEKLVGLLITGAIVATVIGLAASDDDHHRHRGDHSGGRHHSDHSGRDHRHRSRG